MSTRFSCVGCGKCCTSHHIPLTLSEAIRWVQQQGELIVLVEAFLENGQGISQVQRACRAALFAGVVRRDARLCRYYLRRL